MNEGRFFFVIGILLAGDVSAVEYTFSANVLARVSQQHNLALAVRDVIDEQTKELNAGVQASRATETQSTRLDVFVKEEFYQNHREFEQDARSITLLESLRQERNQFDAKVAVVRSTTLGNSYDTGELVRSNIPVTNRSLSGSATRSLSELFTGSVSGDWSQTRYGFVQGIDSQDYDRNQIGLSTSYKDAEQSSWKLSAYHDAFEQVDALQTATAGVTLNRSLSVGELWNFTGSLGRRKTQIETLDIVNNVYQQENYGRVVSLSIQRRVPRGEIGLGASQDLSPRTNGVVDDSKRIDLSWRNQFSQRLSVNINSSVIERKPLSVSLYSDHITTTNYNLTTNVRYLLSQSVSVDLFGRWTRRLIQENASARQASGNSVSLGLYWKM